MTKLQRKRYKKRLDKDRWKLKRQDIDYKLIRNLRHSVRKAARLLGIQIKEDPYKLLGCSMDEFKHYLSKLFYSANGTEMSWNNYGGREGWQLDHIEPLESFDLSNPDELKTVCLFANIQPLWKYDNTRKNKFTDWVHPEEAPF